ncbi:hypothetical protein BJX63DRAFT_418824 [Aspergillus granulosus]|uniref:Uncharacterized protein n=1 Tax=Aspergillus granulosus TaxID=176169 RepID=A0ABR4HVF0_9EURO
MSGDRGYTCLISKCPRSFLFSVVASRSLASPLERVDRFVSDTLALIEILSDPANRAPLEAERALLPCHDNALSKVPFTTTDLLLGLLRDDARPGDVQLQLLSTVFRGDCTAEYGLIVLDISDLDSGVKYGIVAFPVRYMAKVVYRGEWIGWDPWLRKYFNYMSLKEDPSVLRLKDRPLVDAIALDCTSVFTPPIRL